MTIWDSIILGIVQGLTEFLPVSSSGHLVIIPEFFKKVGLNINNPGVAFDVILHFGTLTAVVIFMWKEIFSLLLGVRNFVLRIVGKIKGKLTIEEKLILLLIVGSIPTALIGFFLKDWFEEKFKDIHAVGISLMLTSIILLIGSMKIKKIKKEISYFISLIIGIAQGFAIMPGISRSGTTITAGLLCGLEKEKAAKFSFLLSIPAILGAGVLRLKDVSHDKINSELMFCLLGFIFAAISGYFAMKFLLNILLKGKLYYFSVYCAIVGLLVIVLL